MTPEWFRSRKIFQKNNGYDNFRILAANLLSEENNF